MMFAVNYNDPDHVTYTLQIDRSDLEDIRQDYGEQNILKYGSRISQQLEVLSRFARWIEDAKHEQDR